MGLPEFISISNIGRTLLSICFIIIVAWVIVASVVFAQSKETVWCDITSTLKYFTAVAITAGVLASLLIGTMATERRRVLEILKQIPKIWRSAIDSGSTKYFTPTTFVIEHGAYKQVKEPNIKSDQYGLPICNSTLSLDSFNMYIYLKYHKIVLELVNDIQTNSIKFLTERSLTSIYQLDPKVRKFYEILQNQTRIAVVGQTCMIVKPWDASHLLIHNSNYRAFITDHLGNSDWAERMQTIIEDGQSEAGKTGGLRWLLWAITGRGSTSNMIYRNSDLYKPYYRELWVLSQIAPNNMTDVLVGFNEFLKDSTHKLSYPYLDLAYSEVMMRSAILNKIETITASVVNYAENVTNPDTISFYQYLAGPNNMNAIISFDNIMAQMPPDDNLSAIEQIIGMISIDQFTEGMKTPRAPHILAEVGNNAAKIRIKKLSKYYKHNPTINAIINAHNKMKLPKMTFSERMTLSRNKATPERVKSSRTSMLASTANAVSQSLTANTNIKIDDNNENNDFDALMQLNSSTPGPSSAIIKRDRTEYEGTSAAIEIHNLEKARTALGWKSWWRRSWKKRKTDASPEEQDRIKKQVQRINGRLVGLNRAQEQKSTIRKRILNVCNRSAQLAGLYKQFMQTFNTAKKTKLQKDIQKETKALEKAKAALIEAEEKLDKLRDELEAAGPSNTLIPGAARAITGEQLNVKKDIIMSMDDKSIKGPAANDISPIKGNPINAAKIATAAFTRLVNIGLMRAQNYSEMINTFELKNENAKEVIANRSTAPIDAEVPADVSNMIETEVNQAMNDLVSKAELVKSEHNKLANINERLGIHSKQIDKAIQDMSAHLIELESIQLDIKATQVKISGTIAQEDLEKMSKLMKHQDELVKQIQTITDETVSAEVEIRQINSEMDNGIKNIHDLLIETAGDNVELKYKIDHQVIADQILSEQLYEQAKQSGNDAMVKELTELRATAADLQSELIKTKEELQLKISIQQRLENAEQACTQNVEDLEQERAALENNRTQSIAAVQAMDAKSQSYVSKIVSAISKHATAVRARNSAITDAELTSRSIEATTMTADEVEAYIETLLESELSIRDELNRTNAELNQIKLSMDALQETHSATLESHKTQQAQLLVQMDKDIKAKLEAQSKAHTAELGAIKSAADALNKTTQDTKLNMQNNYNARLAEEKAKYDKYVADTKASAQRIDDQLNQAKVQLATEINTTNAAKEEANIAREKVLNDEIAALTERINAANAAIAANPANAIAANLDISNLTEQISMKRIEILALPAAKETIRKQLKEEYDNKLTELETRHKESMTQLKSTTSGSEQQYNETMEKLKATHNAELTEQDNAYTGQITELNKKYVDAQSAYNTQTQELVTAHNEALAKQTTEYESKITTLKAEFEDIEKKTKLDLEEAAAKNLELTNNNSSLTLRVQTLEANATRVKGEYDAQLTKVREMTTELGQLKRKEKERIELIRSLEDDLAGYKNKEQATLSDINAEIEKGLVGSREELEKKKEYINQQATRISALEGQLQDYNQQYIDTLEAKKAAQRELESLRLIVTELKEKESKHEAAIKAIAKENRSNLMAIQAQHKLEIETLNKSHEKKIAEMSAQIKTQADSASVSRAACGKLGTTIASSFQEGYPIKAVLTAAENNKAPIEFGLTSQLLVEMTALMQRAQSMALVVDSKDIESITKLLKQRKTKFIVRQSKTNNERSALVVNMNEADNLVKFLSGADNQFKVTKLQPSATMIISVDKITPIMNLLKDHHKKFKFDTNNFLKTTTNLAMVFMYGIYEYLTRVGSEFQTIELLLRDCGYDITDYETIAKDYPFVACVIEFIHTAHKYFYPTGQEVGTSILRYMNLIPADHRFLFPNNEDLERVNIIRQNFDLLGFAINTQPAVMPAQPTAPPVKSLSRPTPADRSLEGYNIDIDNLYKEII